MSNECNYFSVESEIWVPIKEYEDKLEVSSHGNVRTLDRWISYTWKGNKVSRHIKGIFLTLQTDKDGYKIVSNNFNSVLFRESVHRLVCSAFHQNPENKPCVNHKDSNRANNHKDNLEWATWQENSIHGNRYGFRIRPEIPAMPGALNPRARPIGKFSLDGELLETFSYMKEVKEKYGISTYMVRETTKSRRESYKGFIWKYI